ncbi:MAG: hypothetical protein M3O70_28730 [Actinomycetota bacterium]|nr:hypothetical protein [Actinomycetota bacterium]
MKQLRLLLALAFVAALFVVSPATAKPPPKDTGKPEAKGDLTLVVHTHSRPDPNDPGLIAPTDRPQIREGEHFQFASARCENDVATFNNRGFDANPNYPGVDEGPNPRPSNPEADDNTAPTRYIVEGTFTQLNPNGKGKAEGTITTILCRKQPGGGPTEHTFTSTFKAHFEQAPDGTLEITNGHWKIIEGTGTFEDLKGHGRIIDGPVVDAAFECAAGMCTDFHATLIGKYSDPTVTTRPS